MAMTPNFGCRVKFPFPVIKVQDPRTKVIATRTITCITQRQELWPRHDYHRASPYAESQLFFERTCVKYQPSITRKGLASRTGSKMRQIVITSVASELKLVMISLTAPTLLNRTLGRASAWRPTAS